MGGILKFLFFALLGLIILVIAVPLLWLLIQEIGGLFGMPVGSGDIKYILFTVACIIFIIWCLVSWNK